MLDLLWLVPVLPFLGAAVNGALGPRVGKPLTTFVALAAPGASLLVALGCLWQYAGLAPEPFVQTLYRWFDGGATGPTIEVGFLLDRCRP
jgi:NADH:ubiquinone oxidoreductase subunit 5 (subunit L)/multisubunit Na+/H+ antiporter MnhA subunit